MLSRCDSLTHLLTHSPTHSLTHSLTYLVLYSFQVCGSNRITNDPNALFDDGVSNISPTEYIKMRVYPIAGSLRAKAPKLSLIISIVTGLTILLSVCSSIFSSFSLIQFIPIIVTFTTSIASYSSYKQIEFKLSLGSHCSLTHSRLLTHAYSLTLTHSRLLTHAYSHTLTHSLAPSLDYD